MLRWNSETTGPFERLRSGLERECLSRGEVYGWKADSTYIQEPPFFVDLSRLPRPIAAIREARVLLALSDSVTTDHISPAGSIAKSSPAGRYLLEHGVGESEFNSYGARRGNDRVMTRGTFANIRIRNRLAGGAEGGVTIHVPTGELLPVYDAAMRYKAEGTPLVILAGKEYGTGSSRDWAAKGTLLLGVRAVLAESHERIHRSNLVGMGVLPLQYQPGQNATSLGLTGREIYSIEGLASDIKPKAVVTVVAKDENGAQKRFEAIARLDTAVEIHYYANGGILQSVLRKIVHQTSA